MKTSEVLRRAGDILRVRGWCQDDFVAEGGEVCALGAVRVVREDDWIDHIAGLRAVTGFYLVGEWNDDRTRTEDEVRTALDAAYVLALQEEGEDPADYEVL